MIFTAFSLHQQPVDHEIPLSDLQKNIISLESSIKSLETQLEDLEKLLEDKTRNMDIEKNEKDVRFSKDFGTILRKNIAFSFIIILTSANLESTKFLVLNYIQ